MIKCKSLKVIEYLNIIDDMSYDSKKRWFAQPVQSNGLFVNRNILSKKNFKKGLAKVDLWNE